LNGECGAPDTPASQPGFGARRGIDPGPMKDEECWRDHATAAQGGCDPIASGMRAAAGIPFRKTHRR